MRVSIGARGSDARLLRLSHGVGRVFGVGEPRVYRGFSVYKRSPGNAWRIVKSPRRADAFRLYHVNNGRSKSGDYHNQVNTASRLSTKEGFSQQASSR